MPKENALHSWIDATSRMNISREMETASNLAFLSATSDDCLKAMAVCVEENRDGEGTTIQSRKRNPKPEDITALLRQVVVLDLYRILSQLRSRRAKRTRKATGKPLLIPQLNEVVHDKSVRPISELTESSWQAYPTSPSSPSSRKRSTKSSATDSRASDSS